MGYRVYLIFASSFFCLFSVASYENFLRTIAAKKEQAPRGPGLTQELL